MSGVVLFSISKWSCFRLTLADEASVTLEPQSADSSCIRVIDPKVREKLQEQSREWADQGLHQDACPEVSNVRMVINASGYDRRQLAMNPLVLQLHQAQLLELEEGQPKLDGFVSAACPDLAFDSAMALSTAADGAIPGMAVRGRKLAEHLAFQLPERPLPPQAEAPANLGADWATGYSQEDFEGFVRYRGLAPQWVESQGGPVDSPEFAFPDPERFLRQLASRDPKSLSVAETITLGRGYDLVRRMGNPDFP